MLLIADHEGIEFEKEIEFYLFGASKDCDLLVRSCPAPTSKNSVAFYGEGNFFY